MRAGEGLDGVFLESAGATKGDALVGDALVKAGAIRKVVEAHEHVDHGRMKRGIRVEVKRGIWGMEVSA